MNTLTVELAMPSEIAETFRNAIDPETSSNALHRSHIEIQHNDNLLIISIKAKDLTALRAALNTYLGWIKMCYTLLK